MDPYKTNRLSHAIQKKLSELLQISVKDPRIGFVSINGVDLNRDHTLAKVYFSVMGDDEERERSLAGLKQARGFLQSRLGRALRLRQVPELRFQYDGSLNRGLEVNSMLRELEQGGEFADETSRKRKLLLADLEPPRDLIAALCRGTSFWIVPHWNPDPDAMGSALALAAALRELDKQVTVFHYPDTPVSLRDLPGIDQTVPSAEAEELLAAQKPDTVVLVDCHRLERTGSLADTLARLDNLWSIDHHLLSSRRLPLPGWREERACSTSTLIYSIIRCMSVGAEGQCDPFDFDLDMAACLYAGLYNDTGGFRFSNTLPLSFELARELAVKGVDTAAVARQTLHRHRRQAVELMKKVLATFQFAAAGRILSLHVDQGMLSETSATLSDTEGFINIATATEGVEFVVFLKELEPLVWRVSLRAPGGGAVQPIAERYGGGGHRQAAGCTMEGTVADVTARLVSDLAELL